MSFKSYFIPTKRQLSVLALGALALSAWQMAQTLFKIYPGALPLAGLPVYLITGLAGFAVLAVLPGHFIRTIRTTGEGSTSGFDWKELADVPNAILVPAFKFLLVAFWSFLPLEMYLALLVKDHGGLSPLAIIVLLSLSFIYFPMALLMAAVTGKIMPSLLPSNVLEPIFKTLKPYILFLFLFWTIFLLPLFALLLWPVPFIGPLASSFLLLYLWSCGMSQLGGFYHKEREILKWQ